MDAWSGVGSAGADPPSITRDDSDLRNDDLLLPVRGLVSRLQLLANLVHESLNRLCRETVPDQQIHHQTSTLKRTYFPRQMDHGCQQTRSTLPAIKPQRLTLREKNPGDRPGNELWVPSFQMDRRYRSRSV